MIGSFLPNWLTNVVYGVSSHFGPFPKRCFLQGCGIVGAGLALLYVFQEKIVSHSLEYVK